MVMSRLVVPIVVDTLASAIHVLIVLVMSVMTVTILVIMMCMRIMCMMMCDVTIAHDDSLG